MIGTSLGPYQLVAKLGEGGMGAVFRARDTKLDRDVALEILPDAFDFGLARAGATGATGATGAVRFTVRQVRVIS